MRIVARTYELRPDGSWDLVLEHVFHGETYEEATAVMNAHRHTDAFFAACTSSGDFEGVIRCRTDFETLP